jgi:transglutaminase-like putative cysteine protease
MSDTRLADDLPRYLDPSIKLAVAGIDLEQPMNAVLLCEDSLPVLYGPEYSPTRIRYIPGSRPVLEKIAGELEGNTPRERADAAMRWVMVNVPHPYLYGFVAKNRAMTEEDIIASGIGWCMEQARVFIALCEVMGMPGRMCFLTHQNGRCGHATAEAYVDGKWAWFDPTFGVRVELPDGSLGTSAELSGYYRPLAHAAYRPVLAECFPRLLPYVEKEAGWNSAERMTVEAGGDLLHTIGICNYLIDGVEAVN